MNITIAKVKLALGAISITAAAGMSMALSPAASANTGAETISCPLTQARRTITNNLPNGWWTTPLVSRLSEAKITTIAGRKVLQCVYGSSGRIQRYVPSGKKCRVVANKSFYCRRPASTGGGSSNNPGTFKTGPITLRQTFAADLDHGQTSAGAANDIRFEAVNAERKYITPVNGAKIAVGNLRNRGYAGCSRANYSSARVSLNRIPVESYICVKTNEGRVSQFRMNGISNSSRGKVLSLGYTTWNR